jgi:hypothetical protein
MTVFLALWLILRLVSAYFSLLNHMESVELPFYGEFVVCVFTLRMYILGFC